MERRQKRSKKSAAETKASPYNPTESAPMMNATSRTSSLLLARATTLSVTATSSRRMSQRFFLSSSSSLSLRFMLPTAATIAAASSACALNNGPCASSSSSSSFPMNTRALTATTRRFLSSNKGKGSGGDDDDDGGSHSDFAAQRKTVVGTQEDEALRLIAKHVRDNPVMLYMKGSPSVPLCGFSAKVVAALKETDVDFASVNVLDYPSIREGVKKYSDWPTIPQLYVHGEFIGGCDIVMSMQESGELKELLKNAAANSKAKE